MKYKALFWNIRSVKTQNTFHRVQMLNKHHNFFLITLMETFQDTTHIQETGMKYVNYNQNGQIWVFIKEHIQVGVISDTDQQLTLHLT